MRHFCLTIVQSTTTASSESAHQNKDQMALDSGSNINNINTLGTAAGNLCDYCSE